MSFKGFDRQTYIVDSAKAFGSRKISKREFMRRMGMAGIGFSGTLQTEFISAGTIDSTFDTSAATSASRNHVPAYAYLNLYLSEDINDRFQLFGSVRNLANTAPPALPNPALYAATNGVYYDTIGRYFTVGARVKF